MKMGFPEKCVECGKAIKVGKDILKFMNSAKFYPDHHHRFRVFLKKSYYSKKTKR